MVQWCMQDASVRFVGYQIAYTAWGVIIQIAVLTCSLLSLYIGIRMFFRYQLWVYLQAPFDAMSFDALHTALRNAVHFAGSALQFYLSFDSCRRYCAVTVCRRWTIEECWH